MPDHDAGAGGAVLPLEQTSHRRGVLGGAPRRAGRRGGAEPRQVRGHAGQGPARGGGPQDQGEVGVRTAPAVQGDHHRGVLAPRLAEQRPAGERPQHPGKGTADHLVVGASAGAEEGPVGPPTTIPRPDTPSRYRPVRGRKGVQRGARDAVVAPGRTPTRGPPRRGGPGRPHRGAAGRRARRRAAAVCAGGGGLGQDDRAHAARGVPGARRVGRRRAHARRHLHPQGGRRAARAPRAPRRRRARGHRHLPRRGLRPVAPALGGPADGSRRGARGSGAPAARRDLNARPRLGQ